MAEVFLNTLHHALRQFHICLSEMGWDVKVNNCAHIVDGSLALLVTEDARTDQQSLADLSHAQSGF